MSDLRVEHVPSHVRWYLPDSFRTMTLLDALYVAANASADERMQIEALTGLPFDADNYAMLCMGYDMGFTITADDGEQVMVGGFVFPHKHRVQCWSLSTERWPECVRDITRAARCLIGMVFSEANVQRMEIISHGKRHSAHHWYTRSLGFSHEAVLHRYGHGGEDFALFARFADKGAP